MKYYWLVYHFTGFSQTDKHFTEAVTDSHPFEAIKKLRGHYSYSTVNLINWKEITESEYNSFTNPIKTKTT